MQLLLHKVLLLFSYAQRVFSTETIVPCCHNFISVQQRLFTLHQAAGIKETDIHQYNIAKTGLSLFTWNPIHQWVRSEKKRRMVSENRLFSANNQNKFVPGMSECPLSNGIRCGRVELGRWRNDRKFTKYVRD